MTHDTDAVLRFMGVMADIRAAFRDLHIQIEKQSAFSRVTTSVNPFRAADGGTFGAAYADTGVTLEFSLAAELAKPVDNDRFSLGVQLLLRRSNGRWIAEGEIGWTGSSIGWDAVDDTVLEAATFDELAPSLPAFATDLCERFVAFAARETGGGL